MFKYYILFVILNILDLIGTYFLIKPDYEYNPISQYIWRTGGFNLLIVFKLSFTLFPIAVMNYYYQTEPKRAKYIMMLANVLVSLPVVLLGYLWILQCQI